MTIRTTFPGDATRHRHHRPNQFVSRPSNVCLFHCFFLFQTSQAPTALLAPADYENFYSNSKRTNVKKEKSPMADKVPSDAPTALVMQICGKSGAKGPGLAKARSPRPT